MNSFNKTRLLFLLAMLIAKLLYAQDNVNIEIDFDNVIHTMKGGVGASWHAIEEPVQGHGGSAWGANPRIENESQWQQVYDHASWLGLNFLRVEIEQRMYEPEEKKFTFDSYEMKVLYKILDWCEANGADVFLQQMWANVQWNALPSIAGRPDLRLKSIPKDMDAFANGLAKLCDHLIKEKKYTCIKWLSINNEPGHDWSWYQDENMKPVSITPAYKAVRKALNDQGIDLPLSAPDWTDMPEFNENEIDFDEVAGAYDIHSYNANFDWRKEGFGDSGWKPGGYSIADAERIMKDWIAWARSKNKPFLLTEMGSMQFGWGGSHDGPGKFDAGIKDVEMVIRGLNIGVDAFNRWSFINRGNLDGQWQLIDTWDADNIKMLEQFTPHENVYYLFGMLSRYMPKHARILKCKVSGGQAGNYQRVFAAAVKSNKNNFSIFLVNDDKNPYAVNLNLNNFNTGQLYHIKVIETEHADQTDLKIAPIQVDLDSDGSISMKLPPFSFHVLSSYDLIPDEKGIVIDE